jgi:hypothetical protein
MPVTLSYPGGRDQEDCGLKPAQENSSRDPISKIPNTKRADGVAQGIGHEFKPQYHKKKKKKERKKENSNMEDAELAHERIFLQGMGRGGKARQGWRTDLLGALKCVL